MWEHLGVDPKDDPEARIRELERSASDFASRSELTSPTTRTTARVRGSRMLCGTYNKGPDLLWTQNKDLLIGDIQGPDLDALYRFWQNL